MNNNRQLYHWLKKGDAADEHKYIRREWRHGRWYYYYDEPENDKPTGQNYQTQREAEAKKAAREKVKDLNKAVAEAESERASKTEESIKKLIDKGKEKLEKLDRVMSSRVKDLPKALEDLFSDDE